MNEDILIGHVRYWHKADILSCTALSAFGGKADIALSCAFVR